MNASWERIRTLFHAAIEQPAHARAAFLTSACDGDEAIRREVESLLGAHRAADQFLESPAISVDCERAAPAAAAFQPGDRIGNFEIIGSLGAGGMGEVYRARDETLRREVAIKLLPRALADDPQRLARFERESRILATLNHPHIATIHSVEHAEGVHALVMELIEGPTLADRLTRGAIEWREALGYARELASALEAAHEKAVVHRDLKPANIKFSSSDSLKLLDFGLAKERTGHEPAVDPLTVDPRDTLKTVDGWVVGTSAYMSPEQARGLPVDKRTDIWAYGCLLFEMLTGTRAFAGHTVHETIESVLERQPDWTALPSTTPDGIRRLLQRCLEKDRHRRLHDIADARIEIEDVLQTGVEVATRRNGRVRLAWPSSILALAIGAAAVGWWLRAVVGNNAPALRTTRSTWVLPSGMALSSAPAVSPDGQQIAFTAATKGQPPRLFVRALNALDARPIAGTDGAQHPFWSPDSRSVGYFARNKLMKVSINRGSPVEICAARAGLGGTWHSNGAIVFAPDLIDAGLAWVAAEGGAVQPATTLDRTQGENSHRWPVFLPDGVHFLYFARSIHANRRGVYLGRLDRSAATRGDLLFSSESEAQYVSLGPGRGLLLSTANGHLEARRFDPRNLQLSREPTTIDVPAHGLSPQHASMFSASADVLIYVSSPVPHGQRFASVDRDGQRLSVREDRRMLNWPRLSPDGRRIAYQDLDATAGSPDLWVEDLERGNRLKVTKEGEAGLLPVWSPDGQRLVYVTGTVGNPTVTIAAPDGTGVVATVACPAKLCFPSDWSTAGLLATVRTGAGSERTATSADVWILSTAPGETARPLLAESFVERDARFSPNGRLVAYVSEESGRPEVSIQRIDGAPARDVISVGGGDQPVWGRDGRELFFVDPQGALRSVPVGRSENGRPTFGTPVLLGAPTIGFGHFSTQYDVSPGGRRIYFFDRRREPPPSEVGIVLDWRGLLK